MKTPMGEWWFDRGHMELLEEIDSLLILIDFLWSTILMERSVAT